MVIRSKTPFFGTPRHGKVQELKKLCKEKGMIFSLHYADTIFKLPIILIKCKKCRRHVKAVMHPHLKDEFDEAKKRIIHHDCIQAARNAR